MAYHTVELVSGLSIYPPGGESKGFAADIFEPVIGFSIVRVLARRELDLFGLGDLSWGVPRSGAVAGQENIIP